MANVFHLPDIGEGLTEAEIIEWFAAEGDEVTADQPLVAVETDKTQVEVPAPVTGTLLHRGGDAGEVIAVGAILAVIGSPGEAWDGQTSSGAHAAPAVPAPPEPRTASLSLGARTSTAAVTPGAGGRPLALPVVRRAAARAGIDLRTVRGSGPGGRVTRADLDEAMRRPAERPPLVGTLDESAEDLSAPPSLQGTTTRLSPTRRAIAAHLARSWQEIPHVTTFDEFDASAILAERRAVAGASGIVVPLEALLIHRIVPVLRAHPRFNATLRGDELTTFDRHDVGIAVDGDDGLLVAVVKDAGSFGREALATRVGELVTAARERRLGRDDAVGATFTLSNIGAVGGGFGTPIIPYGTTAILSIGRARDAAVVRDGAVAIAPMAPLSLSYDHRVIDGASGRSFMADVVVAFSAPA